MRGLSGKFGNAVRCINAPTVASNFQARSFSVPSYTEEEPQPVRKITRKKYSDLPKVRTLPDGTAAHPMEDWQGGLQDRTVRKVRTNAANNVLLANESKVPTRRKRRVKCNVSANVLDSKLVTSENDSSVRPLEGKPHHLDETEFDALLKMNPTYLTATKAQPENESRISKHCSVVVEISPEYIQPRNPLATEILHNLAKFPHCILLTRVGQFYESYFDQATEVSRLLNIKFTHRTWDGHRVPMCGFPVMHLDKYLKVLIQQNKRFVAMCEEFPRPSSFGAKDGFDRRVVRIITPGTLIDESFLNPYENNYLLAISPSAFQNGDAQGTDDNSVGLAWIDVSTGEFFANNSNYDNLRDELARINPREILLDKELELDVLHPIRQALLEEGSLISYTASSATANHPPVSTTYDCSNVPITPHDTSLAPPSFTFTPCETSAVKLLTAFLHANLLDRMPPLSLPTKEVTDGRMQIDSHTIKALEIRESMIQGGTKGSLLSVIKQTVTSSGARLLTRWLCSPSTSITEINTRQSLVSFFYSRPHLRKDLSEVLADVEDITRIVQKFLVGRGDSSDLISIHATISVWRSIKQRLELERKMEQQERGSGGQDEWASISALMSRMNDLHGLSNKINSTLQQVEDFSRSSEIATENTNADHSDVSRNNWRFGPNKWAIRPAFSDQLLALHSNLTELLCRREELERELRQAYEAPSLTLRSSPGQGMHVHLQRAKRDQIRINASPDFVKLTESGSTKTFFYQGWSKLGNQILDTTMAIYTAEKAAFEYIRSEVITQSLQLRRNARLLDELDVTLAFANLAKEMNFVRPLLTDDASYEVTNGRHPAVEMGLLTAGRVFTPNSVLLTPTSRLHVLTGPNMAGKSTLLRQSALIAILAQIGSFVPADRAVIGIVDKLFSRVGAKDDLFHDRSTFMVEMMETATILQRATPRSLVIMDEVGRGTTVKDGLAIAFATIHHLLSVNRCRALFSTHFHELSDMLGYSGDERGSGIFGDVSFFCTDVDETDDGHFAYSYRLKPGVNRDSHGLKVAKLAGLPQSAIAAATNALFWLKSRSDDEISYRSSLKAFGQSLASQNAHGR